MADGHRPDLPEEIAQALAGDPLHRNHDGAAELVQIVDATDVFVRDATGEEPFVLAVLDPRRVGRDRGMQHVERDDVACLAIVRAVHDSHPAAPDFAADVVRALSAVRALGSLKPTVAVSCESSTRVSCPSGTVPSATCRYRLPIAERSADAIVASPPTLRM